MSTNVDHFGNLSALFSDPGIREGDGRSSGHGRLPTVSLLHVGNLPVTSGPWISQFADALAKREGPVGVIRFDRDEVVVEVFGSPDVVLPTHGDSVISSLINGESSGIGRWLVHSPHEGFALAGSEGLDVPTVISGADEAAVTAAYLALKQMSDAAIERGRSISSAFISFAGAGPVAADAAMARLSEATRSFLGIELHPAAPVQQLGRLGVSVRAMYSVQSFPSATAIIRDVCRARREWAAGATGPGRAATAPVRTAASNPQDEPVSARVFGTSVPGGVGRETPARVNSPLPAAGIGLPGSIASVIPGLRALGVHCPAEPDIELAVDSSGALVVLGRAEQVARTRVVKSWAIEHRQLLGLAFPELKGGFEVRERILLGDARDAIALHGTGALLDVLVVAQTPSGPVQVVVPLNDPTTCG